MFNLRDFILKGMKDAVGKMADHQVILNAVGWHEKGVLSEEDLAELEQLLDVKNTAESVLQEEEVSVTGEDTENTVEKEE